MLYLLAEIYLSRDPRWQAKIDALLRDRLSSAVENLRREFTQSFLDRMSQALAYFVDAESAIVKGKRNVDRTMTTCRLCDDAIEDDELARLLHLRSSHKREWQKLL
jgi:hypothetical protein